MTNAKKRFDCVEMMHQGALRIHAELQGKTREEQLGYWRARNEAVRIKYPRMRELGGAPRISR